MTSLVIYGDTSGSIALTANSIAGTNTLTLPAVTGTVVTTGSSAVVTQAMLGTNVAGNGPTFSAYANASQQTMTDNTWTKIQFNVKEFDTNTNYDATTNYRFTPTVAGYYQLNAGAYLSETTSESVHGRIAIYKNGAVYKYGSATFLTSAILDYCGCSVSSVVYANGSTDYFEVYAYEGSSTGSVIVGGNTAQTFFNGFLARSA